jgi:breast cancer metastasis-suppressor 1-like protein
MSKLVKSRHTPSIYSDDGDNENESGSENEEEEKVGAKRSSAEESSDDGSASDSSDMDVEDGEKRRESYIEDLTELENQFTILREQLYRERLTQIESKLTDVKAERAQEYILPLEELQENMRVQLEVGAILRQLRQENIQCKYEAEELAANQNHESEKQGVFDTVKAELEEKTRRLEEDKNNVDFSTGLWEQSTRRNRKRKLDPADTDRRRKPVTVSGPFIVYMLQEADIQEDWTMIKKSLLSQS